MFDWGIEDGFFGVEDGDGMGERENGGHIDTVKMRDKRKRSKERLQDNLST